MTVSSVILIGSSCPGRVADQGTEYRLLPCPRQWLNHARRPRDRERSAQLRLAPINHEEGVMSGTISVKKVVTPPCFPMICFLSLFFVLPRYGGSMAVMVGCASILSAYVAVLLEHFRSRNRSMMAATCLVAAMWVLAVVITALTLMGEIRG